MNVLLLMTLAASPWRPAWNDDYTTVVNRVAEMTWDSDITAMCSEYGMNVVNVTWEDTGRYYGSCWGPNISDFTIQVHHSDPATGDTLLTCMPVIRYPNFEDISADLDPDEFYMLVGNEHGDELEPVSLTDYVGDLRQYLHDPTSWRGRENSLLAPRDSVVLVSAQAVFLPIKDDGEATFNPVLFNYQSYAENPAVLAILCTREGTSATIIDNTRDPVPGAWSWGQRLFFNDDGMRASFTGERLSDFVEAGGDDTHSVGAAGEEGLNMVLLIQIPLEQPRPQQTWFDGSGGYDMCCESAPCGAMSRSVSDVEAAVVGHGELEGPFTEIDGLRIRRDEDFPIRVTVQFYKATSNGIATEQDIREIYTQIQRVYDDASYVGSLVVPDPGSYRPTDWDRSTVGRHLNRYWEQTRIAFLTKIGRTDLINGNSWD